MPRGEVGMRGEKVIEAQLCSHPQKRPPALGTKGLLPRPMAVKSVPDLSWFWMELCWEPAISKPTAPALRVSLSICSHCIHVQREPDLQAGWLAPSFQAGGTVELSLPPVS